MNIEGVNVRRKWSLHINIKKKENGGMAEPLSTRKSENVDFRRKRQARIDIRYKAARGTRIKSQLRPNSNLPSLQAPGGYQGQSCIEDFTNVVFKQSDQPFASRFHHRIRGECLQWAQQHVHWKRDQWRAVLFTDESRFSLESDSRHAYVHPNAGAIGDTFMQQDDNVKPQWASIVDAFVEQETITLTL
ncbi:hypothetical protein TNCV_633301 [Trichonephila clavipes]|nr:hypothetical protein TNCV_633301 [Trichonephila clavipes]